MGKVYVIGLGAGDLGQLPVNVYNRLIDTKEDIFLRTENHPVVAELRELGVSMQFFDDIYEDEDNFQAVYEKIVAALLAEAKDGEVMYAVPGHPMVAEQTVQLLLSQGEIDVEIVGGQSYLDDLFTALKIDPIDGFQFIDGTNFSREILQYENHLIFSQVYDEFIASEVKLVLLEDLPYDYPVFIVEAVGSTGEKITEVALEELDRKVTLSNLTSIYVPPVDRELLNHKFSRLREIIRTLRGPNGCEWDRKQTHESLKRYAVEEVYELLTAIDEKDDEAIIEELGDVLLQVMLHSQIGEDDGYFSIDDVIRGLSEKMIYRHPHVFANVEVASVEDIKQTWEKLKLAERPEKSISRLDDISKNLPSLAKAFELQKEAAKVGFDWTEVEPIWDKLTEEVNEVKEAIESGNEDAIEAEFGDVLFVIANLTRYFDIHPEIALHRTNEKFMNRFQYIEKKLQEHQKDINDVSLEEMDKYWDESKEGE